MFLLLSIIAIWLLGMFVVVGCCRAAALGDRSSLLSVAKRPPALDSHEYSLLA
jgi:hypothetical protein